MTIELNPENTVTADDVDGLERALGLTVPDTIRDFLMKYGDAEPESNSFDVADINDLSEVRRFLTPQDIEETLATIDYDFSPGQIPIAEDSCGNYVIVDLPAGEWVSFWDHETAPPLQKLADNVAGFLELLKPFDLESDGVEEPQVISVWVNPDFMAKIKAESD